MTAFWFLAAVLVCLAISTRRVFHRGRICRTLRGELVKSQAEKRIADWLYLNHIEYRYEPLVYIAAGFLSRRTLARPDFYLPRFGAYIEYWGLVNFAGYRKRMMRKLAHYHERGLRVVSLYPSDMKNLPENLSRKLEEAH